MNLTLTPQAQEIVNRLRKHRDALVSNGFTPLNADQRVMLDNGDIHGELVSFALGRTVNPAELGRWGFLVE